jgi:hypothetical protein
MLVFFVQLRRLFERSSQSLSAGMICKLILDSYWLSIHTRRIHITIDSAEAAAWNRSLPDYMDKSSILTTISCLKAERAKELGIEFSQVFVLIILIFFVQLRRPAYLYLFLCQTICIKQYLGGSIEDWFTKQEHYLLILVYLPQQKHEFMLV